MKLGMVGLGRMGANMVARLLRGGHEVVVWARTQASVQQAAAAGAIASTGLDDLVAKLQPPRVVWVMVPAGTPTDQTIDSLAQLMQAGDVIIDGGNTNYKDGLAAYARCKAHGVSLVDAGTSGGIWGLEEGYCLMVGGDAEAVSYCEPIFKTLAPKEGGYAHVGRPGAGHFSKMVHNGVEYGMLQAYGEGFEILKASPFDFDLPQVAEVWRYGSVVRSWLLDLLVRAFREDPGLEKIAGYVEDTGEGRWTVQSAIDENVPAPVITLALLARLASRQDESFSAKVIAALRNQFGGHAVKAEV
jgi:6-phosphogluconate dehydrogenase